MAAAERLQARIATAGDCHGHVWVVVVDGADCRHTAIAAFLLLLQCVMEMCACMEDEKLLLQPSLLYYSTLLGFMG